MGHLFQSGNFTLHSGFRSNFKIDCDALSDEDLATVAAELARRIPFTFSEVEGVPTGGLRLADHMKPYVTPEVPRLLVVDDVFTTGGSLKAHIGDRVAMGAVIFARGPCPDWVTPLFKMTPPLKGWS